MIHYENLDERTRQFMLREFETDLTEDRLYLSPRLNERGRRDYPSLLKQAIIGHDDTWLATQIRNNGLLKTYEHRRLVRGGYTRARVPYSAADTLAEGEFNRFFMRGLCLRALEEGMDEVQIYRGKSVSNPRPESESLIGMKRGARELLDDLRTNLGVEPSLGLPPGPNSGLTIRLANSFTLAKAAS